MKKTTLALFALLMSLSSILTAQTQLVIEITADRNEEETTWKLFDTNQNLVQESTPFEQETMHRDTIVLDDDNCYYWTLYDAYGDGFIPDEGDYKIYVDGLLVAECVEPNFGDSVSVYNLGLMCNANDIQITKLAVYDYLSKDEEEIAVTLLNIGSEVIESIELSYAVDGNSSEIVNINNLSVELGALATIAHPTVYDFTEAGDYLISLTISKVNGQSTMSVLNNNLSKEVTVVDGYVLKNTIEHHSGVTNPYGTDADNNILESVANNPESYTYLRYMANRYYDLKYFPEIQFFFDYYNIRSTPNVQINANKTDYKFFTPTFYLDHVGLASPFKISLDGYMSGDSVFATVEVLCTEDVTEPLILRGSLLEKKCFEMMEGGSNHYPFYNVVYSLLTSAEGIPVESLEANVPQAFSVSKAIINNPFEEGSLNDMRINFHLQNPVNRQIFQSNAIDIDYEQVIPELTYNVNQDDQDVIIEDMILTVFSNRILFDEDQEAIQSIENHVELRKDAANGVLVPTDVELNENNNKISIVPQYGWDDNTTYILLTKNFTTFNAFQIPADTLRFKTAKPVSIENNTNQAISLFPNPAQSFINISNVGNSLVELINIKGVVVKSISISNSMETVDLSDLKGGVYFIKISSDNGTYIEKIIIN